MCNRHAFVGAVACASQSAHYVLLGDYRLRGQQTGLRAIAELRKLLGYDLPALIVTGDTALERFKETTDWDRSLLHKPLAPEQLRRALALLLD